MRGPILMLRALLSLCVIFGNFAAGVAVGGGVPPAADAPPDINRPRLDARKISFDVDVGTWMSVDVSPDGRTLVFDLLGDIYMLPIAGGEARAITVGPAFDSHPRFSPDGRTIAFVSDRSGLDNIWLMDADGGNVRPLTAEHDFHIRSAAWTPDGNYLIARKEDANQHPARPPVELWLYHLAGGAGVRLTSESRINNAAGPTAAADGRDIYFSARLRQMDWNYDMQGGLWQIWRYDRQLGASVPITGGYGGAVRPSISPDSKTLVYVARRAGNSVLIARDLASGSERVLVDSITRDEQEGFGKMDFWPNYAFTPDGTALVISNHGRLARVELSTAKLTEIPFHAKVVQYLAPRVVLPERVEQGPVHARVLRWPSESPDGRYFTFEAFGRIWLQGLLDGRVDGAPHRLTADATTTVSREYAPAISPDGRWVAYVSWSDKEGGQLWKAPVSKPAPPIQLTREAGHYMNPAWSADSRQIALVRGSGLEFRGQRPNQEEYFTAGVIDAEGGEFRPVTPVKVTQTMRFHPEVFWNADATRLYFREPVERTEDRKTELVSVRLDGSDRRRHLRLPIVDDLVPSPDERWVAFSSRDNIYVTPMPGAFTPEPPEVNLRGGSLPVFRLSKDAGAYVRWSGGGRTLTWGQANVLYKLPLARAIDVHMPIPKADIFPITLTMPRSNPQGSFVLRGARVITMRGDSVLDRADLVVTGNRVVGIGPTGSLSIPSGAKVLDGSGKTVIPGLIDTHAHIKDSSPELFPEVKWEFIANLAYGVTTMFDPSARSLDVFPQAQYVEAGLMIGPRVYSTGDVLYGGQPEDFYAEVTGPEDAARQVRRMKAYGARLIKVYQQPSRAQRIWLAQACREQNMMLTAEGAGELATDMTMVLDGFTAFEHGLPIELQRDVVQLMALSGTFYTPTLLVDFGGPLGELHFWHDNNPTDDSKLRRFVPSYAIEPQARRHLWIWPTEFSFPEMAHGARELIRAGGHVALGAHGQLQGLGAHWELWAMAGDGAPDVNYGMTPMEALHAATNLAAEKIGLAQDLGSIEPGKLADFLVLDANPLEDIHNSDKIRWVVKNGQLFDSNTMQLLWPSDKAAH